MQMQVFETRFASYDLQTWLADLLHLSEFYTSQFFDFHYKFASCPNFHDYDYDYEYGQNMAGKHKLVNHGSPVVFPPLTKKNDGNLHTNRV